MFWLYSGNVSPINNHYYLSESRSSFEWMLIFYSCICADAYQCFLYVFLNLYPDNYTNLSLSKFSVFGLNLEKREGGSNFSPPVSQLVLNAFWKQRFQFSESGSSAEVFPNLAPSGLWNLLRLWQWFRSIGVEFWKQHPKRKKLALFHFATITANLYEKEK